MSYRYAKHIFNYVALTQRHSVGIAISECMCSCLFLIFLIFPKNPNGEKKSLIHIFFSPQAYQRGVAPKSRILPAGGKVLTSENEYNLLSDRFFPDPLGESLSILSQGKITVMERVLNFKFRGWISIQFCDTFPQPLLNLFGF